jgi:hypothetical protein
MIQSICDLCNQGTFENKGELLITVPGQKSMNKEEYPWSKTLEGNINSL